MVNKLIMASGLLLLCIVVLLLVGCFPYELRDGHSTLQYNYHENEFQYAPPDAKLLWNYHENRWEFAR